MQQIAGTVFQPSLPYLNAEIVDRQAEVRVDWTPRLTCVVRTGRPRGASFVDVRAVPPPLCQGPDACLQQRLLEGTRILMIWRLFRTAFVHFRSRTSTHLPFLTSFFPFFFPLAVHPSPTPFVCAPWVGLGGRIHRPPPQPRPQPLPLGRQARRARGDRHRARRAAGRDAILCHVVPWRRPVRGRARAWKRPGGGREIALRRAQGMRGRVSRGGRVGRGCQPPCRGGASPRRAAAAAARGAAQPRRDQRGC